VGKNRWRRGGPLVVAVLVLAVIVSGCGSSSSGGSSTSSSSESSSGSSVSLEATRTAIPASYEGPTTPAAAPKGVKLGIISCSQTLQGCVTLAAASAKAAGAIGWQSRTFNGESATTTENTQIANAVSWGAKVIELIAIDPKTVQTGLKVAAQAGALIVSADNSGSEPNPVLPPPAGDVWPKVDVSANYGKLAETEAEWIMADSGGKANVLVYGDKEYPAIDAGISGLLSKFKSCSGCKISEVQYFTASQIASTVGPDVVNYLRSHPEVEYVYAPFDPAAVAMVTAIQGAGLSGKVKLLSYLGDQQNLEFVSNGQVQVADGAVDNTYNGYAVVDQAIRLLDHMPLYKPNNENVPTQVLDKTNVGDSAKKTTGWVAPYEYESKFVEIWTGTGK
jgi:ribose transport system substrate-binding protein